MNASRVSQVAAVRLIRGALVTGAFFLWAPSVLAQSASDSIGRAPVRPAELKSGTTATILSAFVPGLGHLYADDGRTGLVLITLYAGGIVLARGHGENCAAGAVAALLCAGPWFYGVIDAHNAAAGYNRAQASKISNAQVYPVITAAANGSLRVGIALRLTR
jgi:hypothetical protein